jgi:heptosyltransferase II
LPRSLVIQTSFIGDTILTTPLLVRLARDGPVDIVVTPASAPLLANHPAVRDIIVYDKRGRDRGTLGFVRLVRRLRAASYSAAYLAQGSVRSGALAFTARIPRRVGFQTSAGRAFYNERPPYIEHAHHAERLLALADPRLAGKLAGSRPRPSLFPGAIERDAVDALLREHGANAQPLIALAPGSVWGTKQWPGYPALAEELSLVDRIVVIGSAQDTPIAQAIQEASKGRAIDATGRLSLLASAELIRRARVLVTNDSAPLHLASAMDTPTVAIFGPTVPAFGFGPLATHSAVAGIDALPCRPCDRHGPRVCPLGHWRCMREITSTAVARMARDLLAD